MSENDEFEEKKAKLDEKPDLEKIRERLRREIEEAPAYRRAPQREIIRDRPFSDAPAEIIKEGDDEDDIVIPVSRARNKED